MKFCKRELYDSIKVGHIKKTKSILDSSPQLDSKTGEWALFVALKNNNHRTAELLKNRGASIRVAGIKKANSLSFKFLG